MGRPSRLPRACQVSRDRRATGATYGLLSFLPAVKSLLHRKKGGRRMTRVGLYPGTFDPIHNGHTDIIGRAVKLVDKLVIGVAINAGKGPLFTLDERVEILRSETEHLSDRAEIIVQPFEGLLIHFAREIGAAVIVL